MGLCTPGSTSVLHSRLDEADGKVHSHHCSHAPPIVQSTEIGPGNRCAGSLLLLWALLNIAFSPNRNAPIFACFFDSTKPC